MGGMEKVPDSHKQVCRSRKEQPWEKGNSTTTCSAARLPVLRRMTSRIDIRHWRVVNIGVEVRVDRGRVRLQEPAESGAVMAGGHVLEAQAEGVVPGDTRAAHV